MSASTGWNPKLEVSRWSKGKKKKYQNGGRMVGASHKNGGIEIEVEGGEFVINADSTKYIEENIGKGFLPSLNRLSSKRKARKQRVKSTKKTYSNYGMGE